MTDAKKGFDPLASLFDAPRPAGLAGGAVLPPVDEDSLVTPLADEFAEDEDSLMSQGIPEGLVLPPTAELDNAELARRLARDAVARAPAPVVAPPAPVVAPPAPAPEAEEVDNAALAKALAKAAMARAGKPQAAPKAQAPAAPKAATPKARAKAPKKRSKDLLSRAPRPRSALEAARAAAAAERAKKQDAEDRRLGVLPELVRELLVRQAPGIAGLTVVNALVMDDRHALRTLWKAHRARLSADGNLGAVVCTNAVLRSLDCVATGQLVAAVVKAGDEDFLVWVDIGSQAPIAAFQGARQWAAA